jgi:putative endopeptidase
MSLSRFCFLVGLFSMAASGQTSADGKSGFDPQWIDKSVGACHNFYQFVCGKWLKSNAIPKDQSGWGRFSELIDRNQQVLRTILEKSGPDTKIGAYYGACMDTARIDRAGVAVLEPERQRIAAVHDAGSLAAEVALLHARGVNVFFNFSSGQDFKNATEVTAQADQGGLGLPDRDYYFRDDAKSKEIRQQYVAHVRKVFEILGDAPEVASRQADNVMAIETALAKGSQDNIARRDPANVYHRITREQWFQLAPHFAFETYLKATPAPSIADLNVVSPDFFKAVDGVLAEPQYDNLRSYFTYQLVTADSRMLPSALDKETFDFYGKILTGQQEQKPRWKRCVTAVDGQLGEELGKAYVERTFGEEGKMRTLQMVHALEEAMAGDINSLDWMDAATKTKAREKLHAITNKIGYPDTWRNYSDFRVDQADAVGNQARGNEFEWRRQLVKIGRPLDRLEWQMTPPTVNAYYDPQMNNINFPAGILQPPFYDNKLDDAVNYGAVGAVIGHEITHGFDDEGRQFDPQGNLTDWWTAASATAFNQRAKCIDDEYSGFSVAGGVKLKGKLTLGENTADNGGLRIAYQALHNVMTSQKARKIDGYTPDQRFFLGWGQMWCENQTEEAQRLGAQTDQHSPPEFRVNGVVSNMPEFSQAFGCRAGQSMVRSQACRVW